MMLKTMTRLYSRDPLKLKLHLDYWFDDSVKTAKSISMKKFSQQVILNLYDFHLFNKIIMYFNFV